VIVHQNGDGLKIESASSGVKYFRVMLFPVLMRVIGGCDRLEPIAMILDSSRQGASCAPMVNCTGAGGAAPHPA
jgi:hypothetical protein